MDESTKKRMLAAGKIAFGVARVAGGIATATGHGLLGGFMKSHHMTSQALRLGQMGVKAGMKTVDEGLDDWKSS